MFARDPEGRATLGGVPLDELLASSGCTTPAYVYDLDGMAAAARELAAGYGDADHLVAYAVKANSAGRVVRTLAAAGCGADVVSGGELQVALGCGVAPTSIVFSGVAKSDDEIDLALATGEDGILAIQVESVEEARRVAARARAAGRTARVSLRLNPDVEIDSHAHIATGHDEAKFGVAIADLDEALEVVATSGALRLVGLSCHVGSQLRETAPYVAAARKLFALVPRAEARAGALTYVDPGGGFGIDYGEGCAVSPGDFARAAVRELGDAGLGRLRLLCEPGRSLVAPFGVLVASVVQPKVSRTGRRWLMIDAGMNDLVRPALYQARHRIEPLRVDAAAPTAAFRVVGPICESSDDFGAHELPVTPPPAVVIRDAGAYGFTMASEYNGRPVASEVFVAGGRVVSARPRDPVSRWVTARLAT